MKELNELNVTKIKQIDMFYFRFTLVSKVFNKKQSKIFFGNGRCNSFFFKDP